MRLLHLQQPRTTKRVYEVVCDGFVGRWFASRDWAGSTIPLPGFVLILYWSTPDPYTRLHEAQHVLQDQANSCFLSSWVKYGWEMLRQRLRTPSWYDAYLANKYEQAAYKVEDDAYKGLQPLPAWDSVGSASNQLKNNAA